MQKEHLSAIQIIGLIYCFLLGSAMIMGVSFEAKQDTWIAVIIATFLGMGFMYFFYRMNTFLPGKNLYEMIEFCFTRPVSIFLSWGYVTYFIYVASLASQDFTELIATAILPLTPIEVTALAFLFVMAYIVYLGIEVLARVTEIFIPYIIGFLFMLIIFLLSSGKFEIHYILPVLANGWMPIFKALFPNILVFPFGELVVFLVILSNVNGIKKMNKPVLIGVFLAGLSLTIGTLMITITMGAEITATRTFPLLLAARQVSIGGFIERIDALVVFIMMLGVLVQACIFMYGGLKGLEYILNIPYRYFSVPVSMAVCLFSNLIANDFVEHQLEGIYVSRYIHPIFQFLLPSIIFVFLFLKNKRNKSVKSGVEV